MINIVQSSSITLDLAMPKEYNTHGKRKYKLHYSILYQNGNSQYYYQCDNIKAFSKNIALVSKNNITMGKSCVYYIASDNILHNINNSNIVNENPKKCFPNIIPISAAKKLYIFLGGITVSNNVTEININCHKKCNPRLELRLNKFCNQSFHNTKLHISNIPLLSIITYDNQKSEPYKFIFGENKNKLCYFLKNIEDINEKYHKNNNHFKILEVQTTENTPTILRCNLPISIGDKLYTNQIHNYVRPNSSQQILPNIKDIINEAQDIHHKRSRSCHDSNNYSIPLLVYGKNIIYNLNTEQNELDKSRFIKCCLHNINNNNTENSGLLDWFNRLLANIKIYDNNEYTTLFDEVTKCIAYVD
ncbi:MAG: hypothetical protein IJ848_04080 [Alphaproteobacteria bacterium]|nr:hypothetical protein [Alphaproteobacteria bacterium]